MLDNERGKSLSERNAFDRFNYLFIRWLCLVYPVQLRHVFIPFQQKNAYLVNTYTLTTGSNTENYSL